MTLFKWKVLQAFPLLTGEAWVWGVLYVSTFNYTDLIVQDDWLWCEHRRSKVTQPWQSVLMMLLQSCLHKHLGLTACTLHLHPHILHLNLHCYPPLLYHNYMPHFYFVHVILCTSVQFSSELELTLILWHATPGTWHTWNALTTQHALPRSANLTLTGPLSGPQTDSSSQEFFPFPFPFPFSFSPDWVSAVSGSMDKK